MPRKHQDHEAVLAEVLARPNLVQAALRAAAAVRAHYVGESREADSHDSAQPAPSCSETFEQPSETLLALAKDNPTQGVDVAGMQTSAMRWLSLLGRLLIEQLQVAGLGAGSSWGRSNLPVAPPSV